MEKSFWIKNWKKNNIGFHNSEYNELLLKHFNSFTLEQSAKVLVPLCGKSLDLIWLATQGHHVTGVEVSPLAVENFFSENNFKFNSSVEEKFKRFSCQGPSLDILEGDFFDLNKEVLGRINFIYDRAAIVALPPDLRKKYTEVITSILTPGDQMLLVAMEYEFPELIGPPFPVFEHDIRAYYEKNFSIKILEEIVKEVDHPRFTEAGVKLWSRKIYKLVRI
ncbi:MAG: thiopurine S-methyltransferase [Epsilonproteobacteria bacterium]|nr:MAG: thiopurine S-methyltransferase [Campylobacterota bacterium]RLA67190.1 MAG: thiopurine S-methyltransferase [Campylobacterota bacterium]